MNNLTTEQIAEWDGLMRALQEIKSWLPDYDNDVFYINHEKEHAAIWEAICRDALPTLNKEIVCNHIVGSVKWKVAIDSTIKQSQS